jgi:thiol-disulfide isomerase/thioredoxin/very-short-patch-repair endonuclease
MPPPGDPEEQTQRLRDYALSKGGKVLGGVYKGNRSVFELQCKRDHIPWTAEFSNLMAGRWCPKCKGLDREGTQERKETHMQHLLEVVASKGGRVVSGTYERSRSRFVIACAEEHEWEASYANLTNGPNGGAWCSDCHTISTRLTIEDCHKHARSKGGECLEDTYTGAAVLMRWRCAEGHEWSATFNSVYHAGNWCGTCAGNGAVTLEDAIRVAEERGGKCLSTVVNGSKDYLQWECSDGHEWSATYNAVDQGTWCPLCRESRGEHTVRNHLAAKYPNLPFAREVQLGTLVEEHDAASRCRFDFYIPSLKLGIEYDGAIHRKPRDLYGGNKTLLGIMKRDELKRAWCVRYGVSLLRIPDSKWRSISTIVDATLYYLMKSATLVHLIVDEFHESRLERIRELTAQQEAGGEETREEVDAEPVARKPKKVNTKRVVMATTTRRESS